MKMSTVGAELILRTNGRTDMTKLNVDLVILRTCLQIRVKTEEGGVYVYCGLGGVYVYCGLGGVCILWTGWCIYIVDWVV